MIHIQNIHTIFQSLRDELQEMAVKVGILKRGVLKIYLLGCLAFISFTVLKLEYCNYTFFQETTF